MAREGKAYSYGLVITAPPLGPFLSFDPPILSGDMLDHHNASSHALHIVPDYASLSLLNTSAFRHK